jgi:hypothetical protein
MLECGLGRNTAVLPISFILGAKNLEEWVIIINTWQKKRERTVNAEQSMKDGCCDGFESHY